MQAKPHVARRGFTIVELLIVISIIAVLTSIVLVAGGKVLSGGKVNATKDVIRLLDTALETFIANNKDRRPSPFFNTAISSQPLSPDRWIPLIDGHNGSTNNTSNVDTSQDIINSAGLFLLQSSLVTQTRATIDAIPAKFMKMMPILGNARSATERLIMTPMDAWGRPIRFVIPEFQGIIMDGGPTTAPPGTGVAPTTFTFHPTLASGQQYGVTLVRRNAATVTTPTASIADSDGGVCPNRAPYFYSSGADYDPSTIEDNVYTSNPSYQKN